MLPALQVIGRQSQLREVLKQHLGIENPHHQLLAEGRGQGRKAQFHFDTRGRLGLDPAVLGFALLGDIHPAEAFQAADHGGRDLGRKLIDIVQQPINTEAHAALVAARFDMDIAGALAKGKLQQPVDNVDDVRIVGIGLLVAGTQVQQLFGRDRRGGGLVGPADRPGQPEELLGTTADRLGVGQYALDRAFQHVGQAGLPLSQVRFGTGHRHAVAIKGDGKDMVALGEGVGHQGHHACYVDFQRVDAQIGLPHMTGEPLRQLLQGQRHAGPGGIGQ